MQLSIGSAKVAASRSQSESQVPHISPSEAPMVAAPIATPVPTTTPEQFVTLTKPVTIQIRYGTTVLQPGMKLQIVSRDNQAVRVRYMNEVYALPVSSTDLR